MDQAIDTALKKIKARDDHRLDHETAIKRELDLIDAKQERIIDGIELGEPGPRLGTRLKATETRKLELIQELARLGMQSKKVVTLDEARIKRQLREKAIDVKGLLKRNTPASSTNLTQVVGREIEVYASERGRNKGLSNQRARVVSPTLTHLFGVTYESGVPNRIS